MYFYKLAFISNSWFQFKTELHSVSFVKLKYYIYFPHCNKKATVTASTKSMQTSSLQS